MNIIQTRELRKNMTDAEKKLWSLLRNRQFEGLKFRRQHAIGKYIVDFICFEKKIVIEVDGSQHLENRIYDANRTEWLQKQDFKVIRFWNNDVLNEIEVVLDKLYEKIKNSPSPFISILGCHADYDKCFK